MLLAALRPGAVRRICSEFLSCRTLSVPGFFVYKIRTLWPPAAATSIALGELMPARRDGGRSCSPGPPSCRAESWPLPTVGPQGAAGSPSQSGVILPVRADLIGKNPFEGIKAGSHNDEDRQRFVTVEERRKVLDACPDAQWRLLVALSRYGGLRCPSEHVALTWADVNWEKGKILVRSPKLERRRGGGKRWIPLFAE